MVSVVVSLMLKLRVKFFFNFLFPELYYFCKGQISFCKQGNYHMPVTRTDNGYPTVQKGYVKA